MCKWTKGAKHTRLPMEITELPTLSMRQNKTIKKYNFYKLFQTCNPNIEAGEEEEGKALLQGEVWFSNGSEGEVWTCAGLYDSTGKSCLAIPLGQYPTVFQAEVFTILHYTETLISAKASGMCFSICSDSEAAIKAVGKPKMSSILA